MSPLIFVGIDVSQAHWDIAVRPGASFSDRPSRVRHRHAGRTTPPPPVRP